MTKESREHNESSNSDNQCIEMIMHHLIKTWNQIKYVRDEILQRLGAYALYGKISDFSKRHPCIASILGLGILAFIFPFIILVIFALSTVIFTFSGFMLFEGTLIAFASIVLFGCLGAILLASLFFGGISLSMYMGIAHISKKIKKFSNRNVEEDEE